MQFLNRLLAQLESIVSTFCAPITACVVGDEKTRRGTLTKPNRLGTPHDLIPNPPVLETEKSPMPYLGESTQQPYRSFTQLDGHQYGLQNGVPVQPWDQGRVSTKENPPRKSISLSVRSFSIRKMTRSYSSRGRPHISAPTNFRHVHHETVDMAGNSFQHPRRTPQAPQQPIGDLGSGSANSFRPLELNMRLPRPELSPLMPYFGPGGERPLPPLPAAQMQAHRRNQPSDDSTLVPQKSFSSNSFHPVRRGTTDTFSMRSGGGCSEDPPSPPPKSLFRGRANTSPETERMLERIASAVIEKERLQEKINDVVERQSVYSNSRPATAEGMQELEPMPSIPALPPAWGLTFAERVSTPAPLSLERPRTAPPKPGTPLSITSSSFPLPSSLPGRSPTQVSLPITNPVRRPNASFTLPPPLPLVLRPPLRKKKSFSRTSRVSSWLLTGGSSSHHRNRSRRYQQRSDSSSSSSSSIDSASGRDISRTRTFGGGSAAVKAAATGGITNLPWPVKDGDGFYQCVPPTRTWTTPTASASGHTQGQDWERLSLDSIGVGSDSSTWNVDDDGDGNPSELPAPNAAGAKMGVVPRRSGTFGAASRHRRESVGVAL